MVVAKHGPFVDAVQAGAGQQQGSVGVGHQARDGRLRGRLGRRTGIVDVDGGTKSREHDLAIRQVERGPGVGPPVLSGRARGGRVGIGRGVEDPEMGWAVKVIGHARLEQNSAVGELGPGAVGNALLHAVHGGQVRARGPGAGRRRPGRGVVVGVPGPAKVNHAPIREPERRTLLAGEVEERGRDRSVRDPGVLERPRAGIADGDVSFRTARIALAEVGGQDAAVKVSSSE